MRLKDDEKKAAIIRATVKLVNEIGFVAASVSKIAKEADVSPATIYIYFKNKEDLLVSTYIDIKKQMTTEILKDFDGTGPIRDILKQVWVNAFGFIKKYPDNVWFTEQFASSPYSDFVKREEVEKYFQPIFELFARGIKEKVIKDIPFDVLVVYTFYPVMLLSNPRMCREFSLNLDNMDTAFSLSWDAIKL